MCEGSAGIIEMGLSQLLTPPTDPPGWHREFGPYFFRLTALEYAGVRHTESSAARFVQIWKTPVFCLALSYLSYSCFLLLFSTNLNRHTLIYALSCIFVWAEEGVELILGPPVKSSYFLKEAVDEKRKTRWVRVLAVSLYGIFRKQQYYVTRHTILLPIYFFSFLVCFK